MHDEGDLDRALAEIQEDCYEELYHIILTAEETEASRLGTLTNANLDDVIPREALIEISKVLPQSTSALESVEGVTEEVLTKYQDIILSITKDYHIMKRDVRLKHRMRKNISKHKLNVPTPSSSIKGQDQVVPVISKFVFSKAAPKAVNTSSAIGTLSSEIKQDQDVKVRVETLKPSLKFGRRMSHNAAVTTTCTPPATDTPPLVSCRSLTSSVPDQVNASSPSSTMTTAVPSVSRTCSLSTKTASEDTSSFASLKKSSSAKLPLMSMIESSSVALRPRRIPTETIGDDEEVIDIVVGEVVNPSKIFIQKASEYDKLNEMMDELDIHYQKLLKTDNNKTTKERLEDLALEKISVGDYVAVTWTDNMWYRGLVQRLVDHQTLYVHYIDYGSHAEVKKHHMYLLDVKFFTFPAQAIAAELAAIEPVCDEAQTVNWSGYTTRRILELVRGCHLSSLLAIITHRRGSKIGLWLMDHNEQGINETLVEEGFAKYVEDDENLNQLLSATSKKSEKKYNLSKIKILDEEILSDSFKDQFKVRSLVHRSSKFHEQLNEN